MSERALVRQFENLAQSQPAVALQQLTDYLSKVPTDSSDASGLHRQAALAARALRDLDRSEAHIMHALAAAERAGDSQAATRALMTRAYNIFLHGDQDGALELLEKLDGGYDAVLQTQIEFQIATVKGRSGDIIGAIDAYDLAEASIRRADEPFILSQILKNRGFFAAHDGRYEQAVTDLESARSLAEQLDLDLEVAFCDHDLGLAASFVGDLPAAFEKFGAAEHRIRELAGSDFESKVGHCRALMAAGLFTEAAAMAAEAADACERAGFHIDGAETRLLEAAARLEAGDAAGAASAARRAGAVFQHQNRNDWSAAAELVSLAARHRLGGQVDPHLVRLNVDTLIHAGLHYHALSGQLLLAEILAVGADPDGAEVVLRAIEDEVRDAPLAMRLAAATVDAHCRAARGDTDSALQAAEEAYVLLAEHQSVLGGLDVRVGLKQHAERLEKLCLEAADSNSDATSFLGWQDRVQLVACTPYPIRPPPDESMRRVLSRLRAMEETDATRRRVAEDEVRTLHRSRATGANRALLPRPVPHLQAELGTRTALVYSIVGDRLVATEVRNGDVRRHEPGPLAPVVRLSRSIRAALRRRAVELGPGRTDRLPLLLDRLQQHLLPPDLPSGELVVVPPPTLVSVPWAALPRRLGRPTSTATSLTAWATTAIATTPPHRRLLVAGPDLDHAEREVEAVARRTVAEPASIVGPAATVAEILGRLDRTDLAHFVAHGIVRSDNPLLSSLRLQDGLLSVYEIDELTNPPAVVVLSACHVGLPAVGAGQELLGMVTGFLNAGTSTVVASTLPVPDAGSTVDMMTRFHDGLGEGLSPAQAWAAVQRGAATDEELLDTATFTVFGRG